MAAVRTAILSSALILAGITGTGLVTQGFRSFTYESTLRTSVREQPRTLPANITLENEQAQTVTLAAFHGQWLLVNFIYTHCTTLCSAQNSLYARTAAAPPATHIPLRLVSISFDPARDTPAALKRYRERLGGAGHPGAWTLLRPHAAGDLGTLRWLFGLRVIPDGMGGFEHNAATHVVDPQGRLVALFDWDDIQGALQYVQRAATP